MARRTLRALKPRIRKTIILLGAKEGIKNISTKEAAKIIGISEPTIYVHFKTKEALLRDCYTSTKAELDELCSSLLDSYLSSQRLEADLSSFLRNLIKLDKCEKNKIVYAYRYEREVLNGLDVSSPWLERLFEGTGADKKKMPSFLYVLLSLRLILALSNDELPLGAESSLYPFLARA